MSYENSHRNLGNGVTTCRKSPSGCWPKKTKKVPRLSHDNCPTSGDMVWHEHEYECRSYTSRLLGNHLCMEEIHLEIRYQWICLILRSAIGSSHWNVPPPTDNEHPMLVLGNPPTPTVNVRALVMHLIVMMIPQCFLNKHRLIIETNNPRHFPALWVMKSPRSRGIINIPTSLWPLLANSMVAVQTKLAANKHKKIHHWLYYIHTPNYWTQ